MGGVLPASCRNARAARRVPEPSVRRISGCSGSSDPVRPFRAASRRAGVFGVTSTSSSLHSGRLSHASASGSEPTSPSWTSPFCSIAWISALLPRRRTKRHCGCLRWNAASSGGSKTSIGIVEAPMVNTVSSEVNASSSR